MARPADQGSGPRGRAVRVERGALRLADGRREGRDWFALERTFLLRTHEIQGGCRMSSATKHRNGAAAKTNGTITPAVRVAIYTRQSVTEAKDAEFGSIDAQREAVGAYVVSQRTRGWHALPDRFDDAG